MSTSELSHATVKALADGAVRMIPPVWPLSSSVAVNPFLGQAEEGLATAAARLRRVAGERLVMPRHWFAERVAKGEIEVDDLRAAIEQSGSELDLEGLQAALKADVAPFQPVPTVADLAARATGTEWPAIAADRIGQWAAAYFDEGQALWMSPRRGGAYAAWRGGAVHDLTPEIMGLPGFAQRVADAPQDPVAVIAAIMERLGIGADAAPGYFHTLLTTLGGWAHLGRYELWQAELAAVDGNGSDTTGIELLAIRLLWEDALFDLTGDDIADGWAAAKMAHAAPVSPDADDAIDATLQLAAERAAQRRLEVALASTDTRKRTDARPAAQAAFCIDVRSEVFRRALESVDGSIVTLGFAGFFGLATAHHGFASDVEERRLPVLLNPKLHSHSTLERDEAADRSARYLARAKRAWGRFKLAAVSSFAFVEATGPIYAFRLLRDTFGLRAGAAPDGPAPMLTPTPALADRVAAAAGILRAMSLTRDFARVVLIAGHGANVANNPHASALHCGACGGYSGEVNARLLARLLSEADVRAALLDEGITIPDDTLFVAGLHDTTTDRVTLYDQDVDGSAHAADLAQLRKWLEQAATIACTERAIRLPGASGPSLDRRSRDWSQVRPEWGLAGCNAFIAAPRERTRGRDLAGRVFLHDYIWNDDEGFGVLELIMTAPVVVASWISLQYYGSTVAPRTFGAGNKLLHNVTGGIGVLEGNGGVLRPGLPWQSVHDGTRFIHEPLRLSVMIEAPVPAMTDILSRHPGVRALFDNGWMHLFAMDETGVRSRYVGNLEWEDR